MSNSLKRIVALTKRNIKETIREPLSAIFMIALPLLMEVVFYSIFHNLTAQFEMTYLAPGIVAFAQSFSSLFAAILISLDRSTSFLTRLYVSRTRSYEFIFGYTLSLIPIVIIQSVLFFLVGGIIDPNMFGVGMIISILLSVVTSFFYIGMGIFFGSICNEKSVGGISSIGIMCQSILSGMWFPIEGLGGGLITIMKWLPFKNASDLLRNALNGFSDITEDFIRPLVVILCHTVLIFILAIVSFKSKMKAK